MRLESVSKRYGLRQPWVIRNVSLDLPPGRLIRLEGKNGTGKSTLLRIASGVCLPSAGRVIGRPRTGYVPERFPGGFSFPAREYLTHLARVHGVRGAVIAARVNEWLERLGAAEFAASPMRSLSKGMCQKIAIAQALIAHPSLLVLDEAWTGLDQAARGALDAAVGERVADGGTVVFVDHDPARLAGLAHERWQLDGTGVLTPGASGGGASGGAAFSGGGASGGAAFSGGGASGGGSAVTAITVAGLEDGSIPRLRDLPGVLAVSSTQVRVRTASSDAVLRALLSLDGVHVVGVDGNGS